MGVAIDEADGDTRSLTDDLCFLLMDIEFVVIREVTGRVTTTRLVTPYT